MKIELTIKEVELLLRCVNKASIYTNLLMEEHNSMRKLHRKIVKEYQSYNKAYKFMFEHEKDKEDRLKSTLG